jgi:hypothetical protein
MHVDSQGSKNVRKKSKIKNKDKSNAIWLIWTTCRKKIKNPIIQETLHP